MIEAVAAFLYYEAELLDERRFEEWMDLFAEDGTYWVPAAPDQTDPLDHISIAYDDKTLMATRIARLRHPQIHVQTPPSRTCHMITNVRVVSIVGGSGEIEVGSNLAMFEYRLGEQRVFGARCRHRLRPNGGSYLIAMKRVDLVNCDGVFEPLAIPF
ncbi:MAG: aromatic-ring-hydroxylating dioxygenase subunit beta [Alphaproteobacteria bacterium]|nr:aromatic-ring-hydroxylating dioxygenase subunit beta [Alphaproteobacteria bacterium]